MKERQKDENLDFMYQAILQLKTLDECYDFFEDLCTVQELRSISQRLVVAKLLSEGHVYSDIVDKTKASTATISRVNRTLQYGNDGYKEIFARMNGKKK